MQKKIIIAIILNVILISSSLGIIGYLVVNESINRSLQNRLALATIIAKDIDIVLQGSLNRLYDISLSGKVDLNDQNWEPEKEVLQTAYQYSIFTDGIFLLDKINNAVLTYPARLENPKNLLNISYVNKILRDNKPLISDIYTVEPIKKELIYALVPLKSKDGDIVGVVGGEVDPTNYTFVQIIKAVPTEPNTYLEVVDSHGVVIASNDPKRIFTGSDHNKFLATLIAQKRSEIRRCHRCHSENREETGGSNNARSTDIMAFAPLETAHWGVSIIQPEKDVFAPAEKLKKTFLAFSISSIGIGLIIAIGMSKSIVKPIHKLINATHKIAEGDMSKSVGFGGTEEIGMLSSSFEVMRVKLADSLEGLQRSNIELEQRVIERTKQIKDSQKKVENLLKKVISIQEEERKRIARGLHDETLQSLSALLMKINMYQMYPEQISSEKIEEMKNIVFTAFDGIHNIIQNLRPSILDDLGLEAAIRWLLDKHLSGKGLNYYIDGTINQRFDQQVEITLFRIIQESIINIARHADANNVFVVLRIDETSINVVIEDDGKGFDVNLILESTTIEDGKGLGLLGMKETASLLDGELEIVSSSGSGTRISVKLPLKPLRGENV